MGVINLFKVNMYWEPNFRTSPVCDNMTLKRFFKLRQNVHVRGNYVKLPSNADRFLKVHVVFEFTRDRCLELKLETSLCID